MDFEPRELEKPEVQVICVFPQGPVIAPQPDTDWPVDDMKDQFLDPEPEVINLDSDDEAINELKYIMIVSDDSDQHCVALDVMY